MNYFKFHPVGQGLFYTGSLAKNTYNFVYDCGSLSKEKYLTDSIESYVKDIRSAKATNGEIDFVVVSHLHKDHFNGLYHLNSQSKIRTIYLPYLGHDKNMISLILAYEIFINNEGSRMDENIEHLYLLYRFMSNLYGIDGENNGEVVFLGDRDRKQTFNVREPYWTYEKQVCIEDKPYWKFIFINRPVELSVLFELSKKLENILWEEKVDKIVDLLYTPKGIDKIGIIYQQVFSTFKNGRAFLNMTSTVLIHYPLFNNANIFYTDEEYIISYANMAVKKEMLRHYRCKCICDFVHRSGFITMLTGDINIDKDISDFINDKFSEIGYNCSVLQIPHHGAKMAWKSSEISSSIYVVPFGMGNSYNHPNVDVIEALMKTKQPLKLVNQIQSFEYWIY